jgi:uncharacterized protein
VTEPPRCPICGVPVERPDRTTTPPPKSYFPFCSERCRMVDLVRWLTGQYAIPAERVDPTAPPEEDAEGR